MNREILFRGKRVDGTGWVTGDLDQNDIYNGVSIRQYGCIITAVIPETVGQYTGLNDKSGKEIYEGDLVKERYYPLGADDKVIEYYKEGVIVWNYNRFGVQLKIDGTNVLDEERKLSHHRTMREVYKHPTQGENWIDNNCCFNKLEIIGNIHDNPQP